MNPPDIKTATQQIPPTSAQPAQSPVPTSRESRLKVIQQIEAARDSRVICYCTSTRGGLDTKMAMDSVRKIFDHVSEMKGVNIDLFLSSNGGDGIVPWRLVTLIREYTGSKRFSVLVPFRAFSAATLTALGADEIVMHPMGMLGPTDATVANQFNPRNPQNPKETLGISVEDVTAYLSLVQEDAKIRHEDEAVQAFNILAQNVHPLALGNVKRSLSQSRMMAKKLLSLHMTSKTDEHRIDEIVDKLTSKLFYHGHPINRVEAREDIGLSTVKNADEAMESCMWNLYRGFEGELKDDIPWDTTTEFMTRVQHLKPGETWPKLDSAFTTDANEVKLAFIESAGRSDSCFMKYRLVGHLAKRAVTPFGQGVHHIPEGQLELVPIIIDRGWRTDAT